MPQLSEHFADTELGLAGVNDDRLTQNGIFICETLLEPIRAKFGVVRVHDGYRDPDHNDRVGGKPASFHLFTEGQSAADIDVVAATIQELFDWIRLESELPFDKVIMEKNDDETPVTVHIQVDSLNTPRRLAYIGYTGDSDRYDSVSVN